MARREFPAKFEVVDDAMAAIYRAMTPAQRVAVALDANRTARLLLEAQVLRMHPDWSQQQVLAEVARRMLQAPG